MLRQLDYATEDAEGFLGAAQNARLVASAERYYRVMYSGGPESWNLRDTHMFETLSQAALPRCRRSALLELERDEALRRRLLEPKLERFIGVIYRPDTELMSHDHS